jgi:tRNA 5-methylaminomethyl-2-thiouridine biosynthesis bifunctional protein
MADWSVPALVNVIGGGIAGASVARHLAETGMAVKVFEQCSEVAMGASAIPTAVLHSRLLTDKSVHADLRSHSYLYATSYCDAFADQPGTGVHRTGVLQIPSSNTSAARLAELADSYAASGDWLVALSAAEASERVGVAIEESALWVPHACIINTPQLCRTLLQHPNIEIVTSAATTGWFAEPTVLATGVTCQTFAGAQYLEVEPVFGQIDIVRPVACRLASISAAIVGNGYMAPHNGNLSIGATYELSEWRPANATRSNLEHLDEADYEWQSRHRGVRSVASDRTPIAGQLTDLEANPQLNRYVSVGHGSMGTVSSHYCAVLITARLTGEFAPMASNIQNALSPHRFRQRQARRGYKLGSSP